VDAGGNRVRAGFLILAACLAGAWTAFAESDVLERPALPSARAPNAVLLAVVRADGRLVAAGERGVIVYSDDDGSTWAQAEVPASVSLTNLYFVTATKGWAVGHSGVVLHTEDRGRTWAKQLDGRQAVRLVFRAAEVRAAEGPRHAARQLAEARRLVDDGPDDGSRARFPARRRDPRRRLARQAFRPQ
jgi:hypothetical protein